ncbi:la-related protein 1B-like isoform X2 [Olea europaea var. sylvestris]|uniref:la-related protein 1B-like isoform X1 n=1 Tax=Olea europaea var. sylvestris TaxID=158386 RepID=UPI000C1D56A0|nr:la-related protein 1B-like isoform X1 [Olea europaea var. sylvestris]XP_022860515.1 la-related protein 1B-like isoform X2 [Olea europaea var. sylvestris]
MVMMADSLNNDHSPRSPVTDAAIAAASTAGGGVNSPQSRRRGLVSPWASVVRGDSDSVSSPTAAASRSSTSPPPIAVAAPEQLSASEKSPMESSGLDAQPESSDVNSDGNAGRPRRHAWNTPVNGVVEPVSVMGDAVSWPALSETTRAVPRSSSEPSRPVPDGSSSSSQGPIISQPPQRQANTNAHVNSTANNIPTRQRLRHRGGGAGGGSSAGSGPSSTAFSRQPPPPPPPFPVFDMQPYANMVPPMLDTPVRGTRPGGGVGGSQPHTSNDHSSPRNNSRRGNYGTRPRGDGPYHNNHGGRRDQDRRDVHLSHQYVPPMGYMPSPLAPGPTPFMAPPVRVFPGQMGFDMSAPFIYVPTLPPESFRPMPIVPPPPPMLFATNDHLPSLVVKQIDYYFSDENLVKDNFLRSNMDDQGWVPITLIASFPRVQQLTYDVSLILDSLRNSTIVEVQGDKLRKRNEWKKWLRNAGWSNTDSGPQTPGSSSENVLATSFQNVSLDDATIDANGTMDGQTEMSPFRYTSDETTASSMLGNGEDTSEDARSMNM